LKGIAAILSGFDPVTLEETSGVKLMNRIDNKFWFRVDRLGQLLEQLIPLYDVLEVNGKRLIKYRTIYFDTNADQMYLHHHNGFRDRYKVRRRKYETSEKGFLEIKRKNNKQRTIKIRKEVPFHEGPLTAEENEFIEQHYALELIQDEPVLFNSFHRFTLIDKKKNERCTIDLRLTIKNADEEQSLNELAILEIKRGNLTESSPLMQIIKELKIRNKGLSKYCTGRALLEPDLKHNRFKPRLLNLKNKIIKNRL